MQKYSIFVWELKKFGYFFVVIFSLNIENRRLKNKQIQALQRKTAASSNLYECSIHLN